MIHTYSREELDERYKKLPETLKEAIFSPEVAEGLFEIGKKHGLNIEETGMIAEETGFVILGLTQPREFVKIIASRLGKDHDTAQKIALDISHQVLFPLREILKTTHQVDVGVGELQKEELPVRPAPAPSAPSPAQPKIEPITATPKPPAPPPAIAIPQPKIPPELPEEKPVISAPTPKLPTATPQAFPQAIPKLTPIVPQVAAKEKNTIDLRMEKQPMGDRKQDAGDLRLPELLPPRRSEPLKSVEPAPMPLGALPPSTPPPSPVPTAPPAAPPQAPRMPPPIVIPPKPQVPTPLPPHVTQNSRIPPIDLRAVPKSPDVLKKQEPIEPPTALPKQTETKSPAPFPSPPTPSSTPEKKVPDPGFDPYREPVE